ncbi:mucin-5AC-like [Sycon ciliatum]|uniref:mucin-5AC-like n=1 Tax=Sycon ciliatum TaxID=27933 RepID=UPI0031F6DC12
MEALGKDILRVTLSAASRATGTDTEEQIGSGVARRDTPERAGGTDSSGSVQETPVTNRHTTEPQGSALKAGGDISASPILVTAKEREVEHKSQPSSDVKHAHTDRMELRESTAASSGLDPRTHSGHATSNHVDTRHGDAAAAASATASPMAARHLLLAESKKQSRAAAKSHVVYIHRPNQPSHSRHPASSTSRSRSSTVAAATVGKPSSSQPAVAVSSAQVDIATAAASAAVAAVAAAAPMLQAGQQHHQHPQQNHGAPMPSELPVILGRLQLLETSTLTAQQQLQHVQHLLEQQVRHASGASASRHGKHDVMSAGARGSRVGTAGSSHSAAGGTSAAPTVSVTHTHDVAVSHSDSSSSIESTTPPAASHDDRQRRREHARVHFPRSASSTPDAAALPAHGGRSGAVAHVEAPRDTPPTPSLPSHHFSRHRYTSKQAPAPPMAVAQQGVPPPPQQQQQQPLDMRSSPPVQRAPTTSVGAVVSLQSHEAYIAELERELRRIRGLPVYARVPPGHNGNAKASKAGGRHHRRTSQRDGDVVARRDHHDTHPSTGTQQQPVHQPSASPAHHQHHQQRVKTEEEQSQPQHTHVHRDNTAVKALSSRLDSCLQELQQLHTNFSALRDLDSAGPASTTTASAMTAPPPSRSQPTTTHPVPTAAPSHSTAPSTSAQPTAAASHRPPRAHPSSGPHRTDGSRDVVWSAGTAQQSTPVHSTTHHAGGVGTTQRSLQAQVPSAQAQSSAFAAHHPAALPPALPALNRITEEFIRSMQQQQQPSQDVLPGDHSTNKSTADRVLRDIQERRARLDRGHLQHGGKDGTQSFQLPPDLVQLYARIDQLAQEPSADSSALAVQREIDDCIAMATKDLQAKPAKRPQQRRQDRSLHENEALSSQPAPVQQQQSQYQQRSTAATTRSATQARGKNTGRQTSATEKLKSAAAAEKAGGKRTSGPMKGKTQNPSSLLLRGQSTSRQKPTTSTSTNSARKPTRKQPSSTQASIRERSEQQRVVESHTGATSAAAPSHRAKSTTGSAGRQATATAPSTQTAAAEVSAPNQACVRDPRFTVPSISELTRPPPPPPLEHAHTRFEGIIPLASPRQYSRVDTDAAAALSSSLPRQVTGNRATDLGDERTLGQAPAPARHAAVPQPPRSSAQPSFAGQQDRNAAPDAGRTSGRASRTPPANTADIGGHVQRDAAQASGDLSDSSDNTTPLLSTGTLTDSSAVSSLGQTAPRNSGNADDDIATTSEGAVTSGGDDDGGGGGADSSGSATLSEHDSDVCHDQAKAPRPPLPRTTARANTDRTQTIPASPLPLSPAGPGRRSHGNDGDFGGGFGNGGHVDDSVLCPDEAIAMSGNATESESTDDSFPGGARRFWSATSGWVNSPRVGEQQPHVPDRWQAAEIVRQEEQRSAVSRERYVAAVRGLFLSADQSELVGEDDGHQQTAAAAADDGVHQHATKLPRVSLLREPLQEPPPSWTVPGVLLPPLSSAHSLHVDGMPVSRDAVRRAVVESLCQRDAERRRLRLHVALSTPLRHVVESTAGSEGTPSNAASSSDGGENEVPKTSPPVLVSTSPCDDDDDAEYADDFEEFDGKDDDTASSGKDADALDMAAEHTVTSSHTASSEVDTDDADQREHPEDKDAATDDEHDYGNDDVVRRHDDLIDVRRTSPLHPVPHTPSAGSGSESTASDRDDRITNTHVTPEGGGKVDESPAVQQTPQPDMNVIGDHTGHRVVDKHSPSVSASAGSSQESDMNSDKLVLLRAVIAKKQRQQQQQQEQRDRGMMRGSGGSGAAYADGAKSATSPGGLPPSRHSPTAVVASSRHHASHTARTPSASTTNTITSTPICSATPGSTATATITTSSLANTASSSSSGSISASDLSAVSTRSDFSSFKETPSTISANESWYSAGEVVPAIRADDPKQGGTSRGQQKQLGDASPFLRLPAQSAARRTVAMTMSSASSECDSSAVEHLPSPGQLLPRQRRREQQRWSLDEDDTSVSDVDTASRLSAGALPGIARGTDVIVMATQYGNRGASAGVAPVTASNVTAAAAAAATGGGSASAVASRGTTAGAAAIAGSATAGAAAASTGVATETQQCVDDVGKEARRDSDSAAAAADSDTANTVSLSLGEVHPGVKSAVHNLTLPDHGTPMPTTTTTTTAALKSIPSQPLADGMATGMQRGTRGDNDDEDDTLATARRLGTAAWVTTAQRGDTQRTAVAVSTQLDSAEGLGNPLRKPGDITTKPKQSVTFSRAGRADLNVASGAAATAATAAATSVASPQHRHPTAVTDKTGNRPSPGEVLTVSTHTSMTDSDPSTVYVSSKQHASVVYDSESSSHLSGVYPLSKPAHAASQKGDQHHKQQHMQQPEKRYDLDNLHRHHAANEHELHLGRHDNGGGGGQSPGEIFAAFPHTDSGDSLSTLPLQAAHVNSSEWKQHASTGGTDEEFSALDGVSEAISSSQSASSASHLATPELVSPTPILYQGSATGRAAAKPLHIANSPSVPEQTTVATAITAAGRASALTATTTTAAAATAAAATAAATTRATPAAGTAAAAVDISPTLPRAKVPASTGTTVPAAAAAAGIAVKAGGTAALGNDDTMDDFPDLTGVARLQSDSDDNNNNNDDVSL